MKYTLNISGNTYTFDGSVLEGKVDASGNTFTGTVAIGPDDDGTPYYAFWGFVVDEDDDEADVCFRKLSIEVLVEMCPEWAGRTNYVHVGNVDGWFVGSAPANQPKPGDDQIT